MPRSARTVAPQILYHITQRGRNRQPVFFTTGDRKLKLQLIRQSIGEAGVRILACSLLTNHIHFIAVPEREDSVTILFGRSNGRYAPAPNIRRGRSGHLWQARFHSSAMLPKHLEVGIRYVEGNPCRAGIVTLPELYRWSSAGAHLLGKKDHCGVLDVEFWQRAGGIETWRELHGKAENRSELIELRKCTFASRPFGGRSFSTRWSGDFTENGGGRGSL